jgi:hypothetical protein
MFDAEPGRWQPRIVIDRLGAGRDMSLRVQVPIICS